MWNPCFTEGATEGRYFSGEGTELESSGWTQSPPGLRSALPLLS